MTIEEIRESKEDFLGPKDIAPAMNMNTSRFIEYARAGQFDFPVHAPNVKGARVRVSRIGFLNWNDRVKPKKTETEELISEIREQKKLLTIQTSMIAAIMAKYVPEVSERLLEGEKKTEGELKQ